MVLEFAPLGSLYNQCLRQPLSHNECWSVLSQGLSALEHLHERHYAIVHRDIKPENILVKSRDQRGIQIALSDFGFSKARTSRYPMKSYVGTNTFIAPEVNDGQAYGPLVDIWSLGIVVLELAHGIPCPENTGSSSGHNPDKWIDEIGEYLAKMNRPRNGSCSLLSFLAEHMLHENSELRSTARECLAELRRTRILPCTIKRCHSYSNYY
jgi:serine/threonine protein kinase